MPVLICLLYLVLHAGLYILTRRDRPALGSEKGIFWYHVISAAVVTGVFAIWALVTGGAEAWTWFVAVVMLHGIYSLSFLELWALADDSYSVAIMEIVDQRGTAGGAALIQGLEAIGMSKQTSRLDALQAIGLVRPGRDGTFALTSKGRVAVGLGRTLLFLANVRQYG